MSLRQLERDGDKFAEQIADFVALITNVQARLRSDAGDDD